MFLGCLILVSAIVVGGAQTRERGSDSTNAPARKEALSLVRALATMEATVKSTDQRFAALERVLRGFKNPPAVISGIVLKDDLSGTYKNYRVELLPSPEGQHFKLSFVPKSGCGMALFTDENFVIYEGLALGCGPEPQ